MTPSLAVLATIKFSQVMGLTRLKAVMATIKLTATHLLAVVIHIGHMQAQKPSMVVMVMTSSTVLMAPTL